MRFSEVCSIFFLEVSLIFVYSLEGPDFSPDSGSHSPFLSNLLALTTGWTVRWVLFSPERVYGVGLCRWPAVGLAILSPVEDMLSIRPAFASLPNLVSEKEDFVIPHGGSFVSGSLPSFYSC